MQPQLQPALLLRHPTRAITTFSLSSHAQLYALGSRSGVYLYSVNEASASSGSSSLSPSCVQLLYNDGEEEVAASRFNPHHCQHSIIATSSGPSLYLWDLNSPLHPLQSIHAASHSNQFVHSLGWSNAHPMCFASVSRQLNDDLLLWDARDTTAPLVALPATPASSPSSSPASSSFVAFHPFISYLVASSSDTAIRIYDLRFPTGSVESFQSPLAAPLGSLCWSQWQWRHLLTGNASQQVEVWSLRPSDDRSSVMSPTTTSSAERLAYQLQTKDKLLGTWPTPFGHGLVTHCATNTELQLWKVGTRLGQEASADELDVSSTDVTEVARLAGGPSAVQLLDWYLPAASNFLPTSSSVGSSVESAPQLWALGDDRTIRVYHIPAQMRYACGEAAGDDADIAALPINVEKEVSVASSSSLRSELSYCQRTLPAFRYYSFSPVTRSCAAVVASSHPAHSLLLQITFPPSYPSAAPPVFAIQPGSSHLFIAAAITLSASFLHRLSAMCLSYIERGQRCLLPALTFLQQFVQDSVNSSPALTADSSQNEEGRGSGSRKQVRIEERKELRERKQQQPLAIRKGVVSASTPSLTSLSSSISQAFRLSTSLTSSSPLDEDSSPAYNSAEQSDEEDAPSRDVSATSSSSAMQTMVEEDEEMAAEGEECDNQRTTAAADSKKRKEERDFELLCPRLCGVSWGPRGELVMFNNFPALTHYIQQTKEHRRLRAARKQQPHSTGGDVDEKADGAQAVAVPTHQRHTSFMHDHDEDDWDEINQADVDPPGAGSNTPHSLQATGAVEQRGEAGEQHDRTMDVFPPRTFGHLLQLPFLASYLEPVIREATDIDSGGASIRLAKTDDRDTKNSDAIGMATVSLGAALAVEQSAADGSSSDSDDEQIVNLNAAPLSSLAPFSTQSVQRRSHARVTSNTSSIGSVSPAHSRHASVGSTRDVSSSPPLRSSSPSLLPSGVPVVSPSLRPLAVVGSGRHDKQLASSSIVALPVHTGVLITDLSCLFPVDAVLSASYPLLPPSGSASLSTASDLCTTFERACEQHGRYDLVQMWQLLSLVFRPALLDEQPTGQAKESAGWSEGWGGGAWTGGLVQRLMSDCWQQGDIESVGLIACLLSLIPRHRLITPTITIDTPYKPFVPPLPPLMTSPSPSPLPVYASGPLPRSLSSHLLRPPFPTRSLSALPTPLSSSVGAVPPTMLRSHSGSSDGAHDRSPISASSNTGFPASTSLPTASSYPSIATAMSQSPSFGPSSPVVLGSPPNAAASPHSSAAVGGSAVAAAVLSVSVGMCDLYQLVYAEWLGRLGLMLHRAAVLKCSETQQGGDAMEVLTGWNTNELRVGFDAVCQRCGQPLAPVSQLQLHGAKSAGHSMSSPVRCAACNAYSAHCAICQLSVLGLSSYCLQCGHGGHMNHMQDWFDGGEKECATGCGCLCSQEQMS